MALVTPVGLIINILLFFNLLLHPLWCVMLTQQAEPCAYKKRYHRMSHSPSRRTHMFNICNKCSAIKRLI